MARGRSRGQLHVIFVQSDWQKESLFWKGPPIFPLCVVICCDASSITPSLFLYCICVTMFLWTKCLIGMKQTPSTRVSHLLVKLTAVCAWEREMVRSLAVGVPSIHVCRYLLTFINRPTHCFVRTPIRIRSFFSAFGKWLMILIRCSWR